MRQPDHEALESAKPSELRARLRYAIVSDWHIAPGAYVRARCLYLNDAIAEARPGERVYERRADKGGGWKRVIIRRKAGE